LEVEGFSVRITPGKCPLPRFSLTVEARAPRPLKGVIEALAFSFPPSKVTYSREQRAVTLRTMNRLIALYEDGLVTFCATNLDDAKRVLAEIRKLIDRARMEVLSTGPPSAEELERWCRLSVLELYRYLPKTNCGECGEATCLAFAARVLSGERKLSDCKPLCGEYASLLRTFREAYGDRVLKALGAPTAP